MIDVAAFYAALKPPSMHYLIGEFMGDVDESEDVFHDCILYMFVHGERIRPETARAYFWKMMRNAVINRKNEVRRFSSCHCEEIAVEYEEDLSPVIQEITENLINSDRLTMIQRQSFGLVRFTGLKNYQAALRIGCDRASVKRGVERVDAILKDELRAII